jgi:capsular exopolysaccharide synthesis family protein
MRVLSLKKVPFCAVILFSVLSMQGQVSDESIPNTAPVSGAVESDSSMDPSQISLLDDDWELQVGDRIVSQVLEAGDEPLLLSVNPSIFVIISATPSEGKSTVSAILAVALSFAHSRVLLVDADRRRGRLDHLCKLNRDNGLAGILEGKIALKKAVQPSRCEHLDFITIGSYPDHPAELLMSKVLDALIKEAQEKYDFVIFDAAPLLANDDTTSFVGKMDAVLFTIRCAHTQVRQVKPAMARLLDRNINISGLMLNYVDTSQPGCYYYPYSEYYTDPRRNDESGVTATSA